MAAAPSAPEKRPEYKPLWYLKLGGGGRNGSSVSPSRYNPGLLVSI